MISRGAAKWQAERCWSRPVRPQDELRHVHLALVLGLEAPRGTGTPTAGSPATARRPRGRSARASLAHRVGHRHGREQRLGVRVRRPAVDLVLVAELDHLPEVHHGDAVGDVAHHGQVVGDEEVGQAELGLQVAEQVDDLGLDRHVERGHRLVETSSFGPSASARAMPMRWRWPPENWCGYRLMWSGFSRRFEQLLRPRLRPLRRHVEVGLDRLGQDVGDGHARVERGVRVLEHDLDPCGAAAASRGQRHVVAVEDDRARRRRSSRISRRPSVDLPEPDSPTRPRVSPCSSTRDAVDRRRGRPSRRRMPRLDREVLDQLAPSTVAMTPPATVAIEVSSSRRRHARCGPRRTSSSRAVVASRSWAYGQRGWNGQPAGSRRRRQPRGST